VPRLTADLRQVAVFAPGDWAALSRSDTDLESVSPPLVGNDLVFQAGKARVGYLLTATHSAGSAASGSAGTYAGWPSARPHRDPRWCMCRAWTG
jgi:hypothetical protein